MPFDFFNAGYLAFGNKLTNAFKNLASLLDVAQANVAEIINIMSTYTKYINKNYKVSTPQSPTEPVQCNQLYNILNNQKAHIIIAGSSTGTYPVITGGIYLSDGNKFSTFKVTLERDSGGIYITPSNSFNDFTSTVEVVTLSESKTRTNNNPTVRKVNSTLIKLFDFEYLKGSTDKYFVISDWNEGLNWQLYTMEEPYDWIKTSNNVDTSIRGYYIYNSGSYLGDHTFEAGISNDKKVYSAYFDNHRHMQYLFPLYLTNGQTPYCIYHSANGQIPGILTRLEPKYRGES